MNSLFVTHPSLIMSGLGGAYLYIEVHAYLMICLLERKICVPGTVVHVVAVR